MCHTLACSYNTGASEKPGGDNASALHMKDGLHAIYATACKVSWLHAQSRLPMQNVHGAWVYAVVAAHVVIVLLCLRFSPVPRQKKVWDKVMATFPKQLHLGRWRPTVHLPCADDIKLLVCCLAWPPSCYVSDATDKNGTHPSLLLGMQTSLRNNALAA